MAPLTTHYTAHGSPERFSAYYEAVEGRPPRETLLKALDRFEADTSTGNSGFAIDLGCGNGRDSVELLRRGWRVLAIDANAEAIARLLDQPNLPTAQLQTSVTRFEEIGNLPESVDLINASFSLQFCSPEAFPQLWAKIVASLRPGGRFCGQLFGDRDSWAVYPSMNHHSRSVVEKLLQPFELDWLEEEEHPGKTALGEDKYWHLFQIVARKNFVGAVR
jgi:SAM-dependent methyltransferase